MTRTGLRVLAGVLALLAGCASAPPAPDWQVQAHGALARYRAAVLAGDARAAEAEFARARRALAATADATQVARAELTRCALQVASLQFDPCDGFEALRADVAAPERAYADWLAGRPADAGLLPAQHRGAAAAPGDLRALAAIEDPLARLVAAGVAVRTGAGSPALLQLAADTATAQGWRRPVLAWLGAQLALARQAGDAQAVARLQRQLALAGGGR